MSTFGKKSLISWDYHSYDRDEVIRYHHTDKSLQIKILETWYPIGLMCSFRDNNYIYRITEYKQFIHSWELVLKRINPDGTLDMMEINRTPLSVLPHPDFEKMLKRDKKINKILK